MNEEVVKTEKEIKTLFSGSNTNTKGLAQCIHACCIKDKEEVIKIRGIGAASISQIVKALIISEGMLLQKGVLIEYRAAFKDVESMDGDKEEITAVEFTVNFKLR